MTTPRQDFRPAVLRAVSQHGRTKEALLAFLGAEERWEAVYYDLVRLQGDGKIKCVDGEWKRTRGTR